MKKILKIIYLTIIKDIGLYNGEKLDSYKIVDEKFYTVVETSFFLRCKPNTIYKWKYEKKIKPTKSGGKLLFQGRAIKKFLNIR